MVAVALSMLAMIPGAGAQTPIPVTGETSAPSATSPHPASTAGVNAPGTSPIGTAAYPSSEASPTVAAAAPNPNTPPRTLPASMLPASTQTRSQAAVSHTTDAPSVSETHASSDADQIRDWSVGAGIGWTFVAPLTLDVSPSPGGTGGYAALGTLGMTSAAPAPTAVTFFERRLANGIFALAQPEVLYYRNRYPNQAKASYTSSFLLGLGLRWVGNPNAPVEVGMAHTVYIGRANAGTYYSGTLNAGGTTTTALSWATPSTTSIGTASALVVERMLLPQLWLRVSATVLRISWSKSQAHFELEDGTTYGGESRKTVGVRFGFDPALSLRLAF